MLTAKKVVLLNRRAMSSRSASFKLVLLVERLCGCLRCV